MTDPPRAPATRRLARVAISGLAAVTVVTALTSCAPRETTAPTAASLTAPTQSATPTPPFETSDGLTWIVAACGGPALANGAPNSLLPRALDVKLCMTPLGRPPVLAGVYADAPVSAEDAAKMQGPHRYATRQDQEGRTWVFVVEGTDPGPLRELERYGFVVA